MTKKELIDMTAERNGLTKIQAGQVVDYIFDTIVTSVADGDKVQIHEFATFERVDRKAKMGRNPRTGEAIEVPAHGSIKFKASKNFKDLVR